LNRLAGCIDRGLDVSRDALGQVGQYAQDLQAVDTTLKSSDAVTAEERKAQFLSLQEAWQASTDPVHQHFAKMMSSFEPGLFVGGEAVDLPTDNLDWLNMRFGELREPELKPCPQSRVPAASDLVDARKEPPIPRPVVL
jgi:hypothetical protein